MYMGDYFQAIDDSKKLTFDQLRTQNPIAAGASVADDINGTFAIAVIPAFGPGGPTTDADEEAFGSHDDDDDWEYGGAPSVSGETALICYNEEADELHVFHHAEGTQPDRWILWNY